MNLSTVIFTEILRRKCFHFVYNIFVTDISCNITIIYFVFGFSRAMLIRSKTITSGMRCSRNASKLTCPKRKSCSCIKLQIQMYTKSSTDLSIVTPPFKYATSFPNRIAIVDEYGSYTYRGLFNSSKQLADNLTNLLEKKIQERVAFLCPNNASYVITQWACFMSGQIAVPLSTLHPASMLEYFLTDSGADILVTTSEYEELLKPLSEKVGCKLLVLNASLWNDAMVNENTVAVSAQLLKGGLHPMMYKKLNAMIIYTSGSTAAPKGVVLSYQNLSAQTSSLISEWKWSSNDTILHTLPLHHIHGIVNAFLCPLQCGARCIMLPKFNATEVWHYLLDTKTINGCSVRPNIFMGVPTMYMKLINEYERSLNNSNTLVNYIKATCSHKIRLMVSGSAPLTESVFYKWKLITGHSLLERYGMTEIGMALSNPLHGERKPGFVGTPLPGVLVRITDGNRVLVRGNEKDTQVLQPVTGPKEMAYIGELQVKGNTVFKEYWRKPTETKKEFTADGWFKTGDSAQYIENKYKILGRISIDVIKSGGYKISALFVESTLLDHPDIIDVAVFGLADATWGQKIAAAVVTKEGKDISILSLREWAKEKLPAYAVPTLIRKVREIKRNLMGKMNKKELIKEVFPEKYHYDLVK